MRTPMNDNDPEFFFVTLKEFSSQGLLNRAKVNYTCCYLTAWLFTLANKKGFPVRP